MHDFWDRVGISTSILCVIHCLLTPVLILFAPLVGAKLDSEWFHPVIVGVAVPVAVWALWNGYKHHRHIRTIYLGVAGIICIAAAMFLGEDHNMVEITFMTAAGLLLSSAHYLNLRACKHKH